MMSEESNIGSGATSYRDSDPSALTTAQTLREVGMLKELMETRFQAIEARLEAMDKATTLWHEDLVRVPTQVDKAVVGLKDLIYSEIDKNKLIAAERLSRVDSVFDAHATAIDTAFKAEQKASLDSFNILRTEIEKLDAVSGERFTRIDTQFTERDKRTDQLSLADKTAVAAALQAAKEAVGAQNTSNSIAIAKSESSTVESIRQLQALFNTANAAMTERINDVKSRLDKGEGTSKGSSDNTAFIFSLISMGLGVVTVLFLLLKYSKGM